MQAPTRETALTHWLANTLNLKNARLQPLTGDASFRRYYRAFTPEGTYIVMDAPPDQETVLPFIQIAGWFKAHRIRTPDIKAVELVSGFVLLEDFGDTLLFSLKDSPAIAQYYQQALATLLTLETMALPQADALPVFDAGHIQRELALFSTWFLTRYLNLTLTETEENCLKNTFDWLTGQLTALPQVIVHRDYHSRNLMVLAGGELGVIDFQDTMYGPAGYDAVSLLKDCYVQWPRAQIAEWIAWFHARSHTARLLSATHYTQAVTLCGIQRHLKVLGIFSRLCFRDNKPGYLKDLPLTLHYLMEALPAFEPLAPFHQFMQARVSLP